MSDLSNQFRSFRKKNYLTQETLGILLGVTRNYIYMIEKERQILDPWSPLAELFERIVASTSDTQTFGHQLLQVLSQPEVNVDELAIECGVSRTEMHHMARNLRQPSKPVLEKLLQRFPHLCEYTSLIAPRPLFAPEIRNNKDSGDGGYRLPLLPWSEAAKLEDGNISQPDLFESRQSEIDDTHAFFVEVKGDSMNPEIKDNDHIGVSTVNPVRAGNVVLARLTDGDLLCRIYQPKGKEEIIFTSVNSAKHPPMELHRSQISWMFPVRQLLRRY